jgi:hypothetical protein
MRSATDAALRTTPATRDARRWRPWIAAILPAVAFLIVGLASCSSAPELVFDPDGEAEYTLEELEEYTAEADPAPAEGVVVSEAAETREQLLIELRTRGDEGRELATMLTEGFPPETASVPVLAEAAFVDGQEVWLVVEAWGDEEGELTHRRLWVFAREDGTLVHALSVR